MGGTKDHLISDRIIQLIGPKLMEFRQKLMKEKSPKTLTELLKTITPPKGIVVQFLYSHLNLTRRFYNFLFQSYVIS